MRPIRNFLREMGIPVEGSKGEAGRSGRVEYKYADALTTADHHTLAKHGIKEIAHQRGYAATLFLNGIKTRLVLLLTYISLSLVMVQMSFLMLKSLYLSQL